MKARTSTLVLPRPALLRVLVVVVVAYCCMVRVRGNVVIMLADDMGVDNELYGEPACKLPNLLSLASRGVVYNSASASVSSCSPSRASILTGLPCHQNGMYGLHQGYHNFESYSTVRSLPLLLQGANIRTGIIGKKHVGPEGVYPFEFSETEENNSIMQVGRNISLIRDLVRTFLKSNDSRPFLLYIGFHDPHRCSHTHPEFGQFCEKFGNGEPGMGYIPDWTPIIYSPDEVHVPYFVQNTLIARLDLSAQYTTISRLDQGVGLVMEELRRSGLLNQTLVLFSSDNGVPYAGGRTNVYEPGLQIPLIVSSPQAKRFWGTRSDKITSLLDITPTVLDWFNIVYPKYSLFRNNAPVSLTGMSLLRTYSKDKCLEGDSVYASHSLHEITMYYPMRAIKTSRYKLIHNINYRMPFPIDQDFYISPIFQDILNRTIHNDLSWYKTLNEYYNRPQYEMFDLKVDPRETNNVAGKKSYAKQFDRLQKSLQHWQNKTQDPWICSPGGVLQDAGKYAHHHQCFPLYNGL